MARAENPQDPHVWCDCFRDTIPLSAKVRGRACLLCRQDAGEDTTGEVAAVEVGELKARLKELKRKRQSLEWDIDSLEDQLDHLQSKLEEVEDDIEAVEARLDGGLVAA